MVYGDGSGQLFQLESLTTALDVIGHELTHGVTQYTAGLAYHDQPGALDGVDVGRFWLTRQAICPRPECRPGRLADRLGDFASGLGEGIPLDGQPGNSLGIR